MWRNEIECQNSLNTNMTQQFHLPDKVIPITWKINYKYVEVLQFHTGPQSALFLSIRPLL
jgi:hypothetical protein